MKRILTLSAQLPFICSSFLALFLPLPAHRTIHPAGAQPCSSVVTIEEWSDSFNNWISLEGAGLQKTQLEGMEAVRIQDSSDSRRAAAAHQQRIKIEPDRPYSLYLLIHSNHTFQTAQATLYQFDSNGVRLNDKNIDLNIPASDDGTVFEHRFSGFDPAAESVCIVLRPVIWTEDGLLKGRADFAGIHLKPLFENLLPEGDIETSPEAWVRGSLDADIAHSGNISLKVEDKDSTKSIYAYNRNLIEVDPLVPYSLQAWIRTESDDQPVLVALHQFNDEKEEIGDHIDFHFTPGAGWSLMHSTATHLDPHTRYVRLLLFPLPWSSSGRETGTAWFDDIRLTPAGHNLIPNSSFERPGEGRNPIQHWVGGQRSESNPWHGNAAAYVEAQQKISLESSSLSPLDPTRSYEFLFWIKAAHPSPMFAHLQFVDQDSNILPNSSSIQYSIEPAAEWTVQRIRLDDSQIPAAARFLHLQFISPDTGFHLDRVTFRMETDPIEGTMLLESDSAVVWWAPPDQKVLPEDTLPPDAPQSSGITIHTALNDRESFQLVFTPKKNTRLNNVEVKDISPGMANQIQGGFNPVAIYLAETVPIQHPSNQDAIQANEIPDPLTEPPGTIQLQAGRSQTLWFNIFYPKDMPTGDYEYIIHFKLNNVSHSIPLRVHIWNFSLPETTSLQTNFGFSLDQIKVIYGQQNNLWRSPWSNYISEFAYNRISPHNPFPENWYGIDAECPEWWAGDGSIIDDPGDPNNHVLSTTKSSAHQTMTTSLVDLLAVSTGEVYVLSGRAISTAAGSLNFDIRITEYILDSPGPQTTYSLKASQEWEDFIIPVEPGENTSQIKLEILSFPTTPTSTPTSVPGIPKSTLTPSIMPNITLERTSESLIPTGTIPAPSVTNTAELIPTEPSPSLRPTEEPSWSPSPQAETPFPTPTATPTVPASSETELPPTLNIASSPGNPGRHLASIQQTSVPTSQPPGETSPQTAAADQILFDDISLVGTNTIDLIPGGDFEPCGPEDMEIRSSFAGFDHYFSPPPSINSITGGGSQHFSTYRLYLPYFPSALEDINPSNGSAPPGMLSFQWGDQVYKDAYAQIFHTISEHMYSLNMQDQVFAFWADEPSPAHMQDVVYGMEALDDPSTPIRRALTLYYYPHELGSEIENLTEIWILAPQNLRPDWVEDRQSAGDEVWWYVSGGVRKPYANLLIDYPGTDIRSMFWLGWKMDMTGMFYWQTAHWFSDVNCQKNNCPNPWTNPATYEGSQFQGNGDGMLLYPPKNWASGSPDQYPVPSMRWELVRNGIEDYELLHLLEESQQQLRKIDPGQAVLQRADALLLRAEQLAGTASSYPSSSSEYRALRIEIGETVEAILQKMRP